MMALTPVAIIVAVCAIVVVWGTFILTILIFFKGARVGEADLTHGDDPEWTASR